MKYIFCIFIFCVFFIAAYQPLKAANSLKLGTFTPPIANLPLQPNAECTDKLAEDVINRYGRIGGILTEETANRQLLQCDIFRYLVGCTNSSWACTGPCMYIPGGPSMAQIEAYPGVRDQVTQFHAYSSELFAPHYIYTKAVGRFDLRMGFGLSTEGEKEMYDTLASMTCQERVDQIHGHLGTPLYFYPEKKQHLTISIPNYSETIIEADPDGTFLKDGKQYGSLHYETKALISDPPIKGITVPKTQLLQTLNELAGTLQ